MAKKHSITGVADRDALPPRREPYWQRVEERCYLGFRKLSAKAPGTWATRYNDAATARQVTRTLGALDHVPPSARFDEAMREARKHFTHLKGGGSAEAITVGEACRRYVQHLRDLKRGAAAKDAEARFGRHVHHDRLAAIRLDKLTPRHVGDWRTALTKKPARLQDGSEGGERAAASLNRDMTALRSALNHAMKDGATLTAFAWADKLKPVKGATRRRESYLAPAQRRALIDAASAEIAPFLTALCLLPLRPGALAALTVGDLSAKLSTLTIGKDKSGKARTIGLPPATSAHLQALAKNKTPKAPLIARADGKGWNKDAWKGPIKDAVKAASLPTDVTAYTLRHSTITDLVSVHHLDLLTVAQLAGTSLVMIQQHYGHLLQEQSRNALQALASDIA